MAWAATRSGMSRRTLALGGLVHTIADAGDGADLARLQAMPMAGAWVSLSIASRPDYWAASRIHGEHGVVLIRRPTGEPVGMCARSVRRAYVDGAVRSLGYFGELRVADPRRRRPGLFRNGYEAMRRLLHEPARTPFYLTAIAEGNAAAMRLLTSGLPGIPTYRPAGGITTLALSARARTVRRESAAREFDIRAADEGDLAEIVSCLERNHRRYQFAPVWTADDLRDPGLARNLSLADFLLARRAGKVIGCLAIWDQRPFKEVVVAGYRRGLARWRPAVNVAATCMGWPRLPGAGSTLEQAFLSHVAVDDDDPAVLVALIRRAQIEARRRGIALLLIGLGEGNPMLAPVQTKLPHRAYRSRLYLAHWADGGEAVARLSARVPHPEVAVL